MERDKEMEQEINEVVTYPEEEEMLLASNETETDEAEEDPEYEAALDRAVEQDYRKLEEAGMVSDPERFDPRRMYDVKSEQEVGMEALQTIFLSHYNNTVLKARPVRIEEYMGKRCMVFYIGSDRQRDESGVYQPYSAGVKCILPEDLAGLRRRQVLENLYHLPYIRIMPEEITFDRQRIRESGVCLVSRVRADKVAAERAWRRLSEGNLVEGIYLGRWTWPATNGNGSGRTRGLLLDIEGVIGAIPLNEISYEYVDVDALPGEFKYGDRINVVITAKEERKRQAEDGTEIVRRRFIASRRAAMEDPWKYEENIPKVGSSCYVRIKSVTDSNVYAEYPINEKISLTITALLPSLGYEGRQRQLTPGEHGVMYITYVDKAARRIYGTFNARVVKREINYFKRRAARKATGDIN